MRRFILIAAAMSGTLALAAPAIAQDAAPDAKLPTCSAAVADHCMQREHHAKAAMHHMGGHHMARHHHAKKHHAK